MKVCQMHEQIFMFYSKKDLSPIFISSGSQSVCLLEVADFNLVSTHCRFSYL